MSIADFCVASIYLDSKLNEPEFFKLFKDYEVEMPVYIEKVLETLKKTTEVRSSLPEIDHHSDSGSEHDGEDFFEEHLDF
jgi:hypothetical protein